MIFKAITGLVMIFLGGFLMLAGGAEQDGAKFFFIGGGAVLIMVGFAIFIGRRSS